MSTENMIAAEEANAAVNTKNEDLSNETNEKNTENGTLTEYENEPEENAEPETEDDLNLSDEESVSEPMPDISIDEDDFTEEEDSTDETEEADSTDGMDESTVSDETGNEPDTSAVPSDESTQTASRRRTAPLSAMDQKVADSLAESIAKANEPTMPELRRQARERIAQNGGTIRHSHAEAIREARTREREREARRGERYEALAIWNSLIVAQRRNMMQMGDVQAVEELQGQIMAVLSLRGIRTLVPFKQFFLADPIEYATVTSNSDLRRRQMQMLTRTIGMRTPVVIEQMMKNDENISESVVLANRKAALEILNQRTFGEGKNALKEGDIVQRHITSVSHNALRVLIGGTEAQLPKFRATNRYIEDMSEVFRLNQPIEVAVRQIEQDANGLYRLIIDARPPERMQMADRLDKIREDGRYIGYVTHIHQSARGNIIYHLHLKMQDVVAIASGIPTQYMQRPLQPGDAVVFRAVQLDYGQGYVQGRILRLC